MALSRVLVVDDDPDFAAEVADLLGAQGYAVDRASNGMQALHRVRSNPPAAIILDINLPIMDGWQFIAAYRASGMPQAPIFVLSGSPGLASQARSVGLAGFAAKPCHPQILVSEVCRINSTWLPTTSLRDFGKASVR